MAAEDWTDALHNYINGQEWQQSIEMFVKAHCRHFQNLSDSDFTHEHHKIWTDFKDIVEVISR